jgi:hypothetical protein
MQHFVAWLLALRRLRAAWRPSSFDEVGACLEPTLSYHVAVQKYFDEHFSADSGVIRTARSATESWSFTRRILKAAHSFGGLPHGRSDINDSGHGTTGTVG